MIYMQEGYKVSAGANPIREDVKGSQSTRLSCRLAFAVLVVGFHISVWTDFWKSRSRVFVALYAR